MWVGSQRVGSQRAGSQALEGSSQVVLDALEVSGPADSHSHAVLESEESVSDPANSPAAAIEVLHA